MNMNTSNGQGDGDNGLDQMERSMLIDFLLSHIDETDEERFQEIDFTVSSGELVYTTPDGCQVMFRHIDQLLLMLKNAFMMGSRLSSRP